MTGTVRLSTQLSAFCDRIGHSFSRPELLVRALTHGSIATPTRPDNQRLEFLGDRVLGLVMAEALYQADAEAPEGTLAPRYNALVRKETCAEVARSIDLGAVLRLGRSEMISGGRRKQALLGDAMEAVIGAVFLDAGWEAARAMVLRLWKVPLAGADQTGADPKNVLQELVQGRGEAPPVYAEVARDGPDHAPVFEIEVRLETGQTARAVAGSKRAAERAAAAALLAQLADTEDGAAG